MRKMACGLCLVPRGWEDTHGSLLLSKHLFVLPSPRGTCPMRGNDSFCYRADVSVSVTITPFSKKHYFSWLSPSWKMWPLKPEGGCGVGMKNEGETTNVLATQTLNGVLGDDQSVSTRGTNQRMSAQKGNSVPCPAKGRGTVLRCWCWHTRYCERNKGSGGGGGRWGTS